MQTDSPEDRASARLNQLRYQRLKDQNGKQNGIVDVDRIQTRSMSISQVSKMPENALMRETVCDKSTMRMEAITLQGPIRISTDIPFLSTMPMLAISNGILPEVNTPPYINRLTASHSTKGVFFVLIARVRDSRKVTGYYK